MDKRIRNRLAVLESNAQHHQVDWRPLIVDPADGSPEPVAERIAHALDTAPANARVKVICIEREQESVC